jgi:hypothetical protein
MRGIVGLVLSLALMLAFASVAVAGPRTEQYSSNTEVTKTQTSGTLGATASEKSPTVTTAATGSLPFTGLELGVAVVAGSALLGAGLLVRRVARQRDNS